MNTYQIGSEGLSLSKISEILKSNAQLELSVEAKERIESGRLFLESYLEKNKEPVYGINTGFGALCNVRIQDSDLAKLQRNLIVSHACGTGETAPAIVSKLMLLLKVQALSKGYSGITVSTTSKLIELYNHQWYPQVFNQGSLGASGDLAPLAHLCLPLLGLGKVLIKGEYKTLSEEQFKPIDPASKEGLALLNGTQFMSAYGVYVLLEAYKLLEVALHIAAMSVDGFLARTDPFYPAIHTIRPHKGQIHVAKRMMQILQNSGLQAEVNRPAVQDPYTFRCIPQVLGASYDTFEYARTVIEQEINSVTDNPLVIPEEDLIVSGGNFHGQPLALVLDFVGIALAEIGNMSERRTYQLISGSRGLPYFLASDPGLESGYMIPQYTAASIVTENKMLCHPASVDSIPSSNGQEDHVSMGALAAVKANKILENVKTILSIEFLTAYAALQFRKPMISSPSIENFIAQSLDNLRIDTKDHVHSEDIHHLKSNLFKPVF